VIRRVLGRLLGVDDPNALPTSAGWERYARAHAGDAPLGEEWNLPEALGVDLPPDRIVPVLDRDVFGPFLGACDTILEIGPGGGRWTAVLLPRCRRLLAADTSPTMLAMLARRFPADPRLERIRLDGRGLAPVADGSVDGVFSFDVFVHRQADPTAFLPPNLIRYIARSAARNSDSASVACSG
jgi:SAM-dependent methyltransferase